MRHFSFPHFTTFPAYVLSSALWALAIFGLLASLGTFFSWRFFEPGLTVFLATFGLILLAFLPTYFKFKEAKNQSGEVVRPGMWQAWMPTNPLEAVLALVIYGFAANGIYYTLASIAGGNFTRLTVMLGLVTALPMAGVGFNRHISRGHSEPKVVE